MSNGSHHQLEEECKAARHSQVGFSEAPDARAQRLKHLTANALISELLRRTLSKHGSMQGLQQAGLQQGSQQLGLQHGSQRGLQSNGLHGGGQQEGGGQQIGLYREGLGLRTALGELVAFIGVVGAWAGEPGPCLASNIMSAPDSLGRASDLSPRSSCVRSQLSMPLSCTATHSGHVDGQNSFEIYHTLLHVPEVWILCVLRHRLKAKAMMLQV